MSSALRLLQGAITIAAPRVRPSGSCTSIVTGMSVYAVEDHAIVHTHERMCLAQFCYIGPCMSVY